MRRRVLLDPRDAAPVLKHVHPTVRKELKEALRRLADDPSGRSARLDVKELRTQHPHGPAHRLRVGEWRAVFLVRKDRVLVLRVFHRSDGYGWLERLGASGPSGPPSRP